MANPVSRRLTAGLILVGISLLNLAANTYWLHTGDVHRPNWHSVMRGGWTGFWVTTVLFSGLFVVGVTLLVFEWHATRRARVRGGS
jgi:uncharacterized membrane protein